MENVINRIISIEERAKEIISDAQKMEYGLKNDIDKDIENIRTDINGRVTKKYETIKTTEKNYADKKIEELSQTYKKAEENLDKVCKEKKDEWVNSIYSEIIGIV